MSEAENQVLTVPFSMEEVDLEVERRLLLLVELEVEPRRLLLVELEVERRRLLDETRVWGRRREGARRSGQRL